MLKVTFSQLIGMAGVAADETPRARQWARHFEAPMIVIALWLLMLWYLETRHRMTPEDLRIHDGFIWLFFLTEAVVLTSLVRDKWRYLASNWVNILIIIAGIGLFWGYTPLTAALRSLRLLLVAGMLLQVSSGVRRILSRHHLGSTLLVSILVIVMAGVVVAGIDPAVKSIGDGVWWAWVTVTTVGYGDIVPVTTEGRLFAAALIAVGMGLSAMLTASFTVYFVEQEEEKEEEDLLMHPKALAERLLRIEAKLDSLLGERSPPASGRTQEDPQEKP